METGPAGRVPVYVLAGGRSRRFGSDKARLLVGGEPLLLRVARELMGIASSVRVVTGERARYADLGLPTIPDAVPGKGPMGGLLTALEDAAPAPWIFLAACDLVGVRLRWARELLGRRSPKVRAVVCRTDRYHPLFAVYHTDLRMEVRQRIRSGELTMQRLFEAVPAAVVPAPPGFESLVNLNHPEDLGPERG